MSECVKVLHIAHDLGGYSRTCSRCGLTELVIVARRLTCCRPVKELAAATIKELAAATIEVGGATSEKE